jgi:hypothetical protein
MIRILLALAVFAQGPLVITNDPGGIVAVRAARVAALGDREVRIEGNCLSACTMYLGAANVCVARNARLSFHGPSHWGFPLPRADFDFWSGVLARHYPDAIAHWFMQTARHRIHGHYTLTGAEVIRHGVRECGPV